MKPKIKFLFTAFLCSMSSVLIAQSVNIITAKAIGEHHLANINSQSLKSASIKSKSFHFTSVKVAVENKDTLYYILNDTINMGFVIVSADKRAWPILGYSTEGSFNDKKQPEAFTAWMENRKKEIVSIKLNNLQPDSATVASWQNLSLKNASTASNSVEPLTNSLGSGVLLQFLVSCRCSRAMWPCFYWLYNYSHGSDYEILELSNKGKWLTFLFSSNLWQSFSRFWFNRLPMEPNAQ